MIEFVGLWGDICSSWVSDMIQFVSLWGDQGSSGGGGGGGGGGGTRNENLDYNLHGSRCISSVLSCIHN